MQNAKLGAKMQYSIFENIEHHKDYPAKIFVVSIDHSDLHWHYDYELVVVLKGSLTLNYGLQRYVIREGDIVLVNSKIIHGYRNIIDNLCLFVQFPPQLLEQVLNKNQVYYFYLNSASKTMRPKTQFSVFVHTAVELGMRRNPRNPADILRINSLLYMLLADLVEYSHYDIYQYPDRAAFENDSEMFLRAIQFVEQNLKNENIKQELCRYVGMSEKTLYRFLKSITGFTISDLINSIRIQKAKIMLKQSDKSVSFISQECGFNYEATFYRMFKKETGVTPNEYRQRGGRVQGDPKVQGYLSFNRWEAEALLKKYFYNAN